ncbi:MAG: DUF6599 family protein [Bacteroidales bacterium]|nr:DUF6599 family protein [Bacteroidales bacterium]
MLLSLSTTTLSQQSVYEIIKTDTCPDITLLEDPELYIGDDLFSLINGGAELYHEYGFVEVLACTMETPSGTKFKCEIYDMGSPEAAWGIYSVTETSNSKPFHAGTAGRSGEGFAQFIKDRYMFYMYHESSDVFDLQYLAGCLAAKISNNYPEPLLMKQVGSAKEDALKTIYFKGNLGLSTVYSFHYKDVFNYREGAAAIYPDLKVILLDYEDEIQCLENYNKARDFFMNSSKYHDHASLRGSFHMKDRKEQQIDCYFENSFLIIFISSGEHDLNDMREAIVDSME